MLVDGTEELVMDAIGVDARGAQAADKVAQEGARAAKINIRLANGVFPCSQSKVIRLGLAVSSAPLS